MRSDILANSIAKFQLSLQYCINKAPDYNTTRITKNYEFKKGVGIDSTIKSTETRILLSQFIVYKSLIPTFGIN